MYESPIKIYELSEELIKSKDNFIYATVKMHVDVDKDELIKALQYDRGQYDKGYHDGYFADKWIPCKERLPEDWMDVLVCLDVADTEILPFAIDFVYDGGFARNDNVIAWMPLPPAYKEE